VESLDDRQARDNERKANTDPSLPMPARGGCGGLVQSRNGEFEFAGMLFHQLLEASEGHMHRLGTGLDTEDSRRFIN
jgi:hypothetical protein